MHIKYYNAENVSVFLDTMIRLVDTPATEYIPGGIAVNPRPGDCNISIIASDTFSACRDGDIALNFASGYTPGGGVLKGSTAQEEDLCRRSSLYRGLISREAQPFYQSNRGVPHMGTDAMLLSRGVTVIKSADYRPCTPITVDVLTVAAPRLIDFQPDALTLVETLGRRIDAIVSVLAAKGYRRAILGAWGCGAYRNDPATISRLFRLSLDRYAGYFDEIVFAIPDPAGRNFLTFRDNLL